MKLIISVVLASCSVLVAGAASANEALAKSSGCLNCHAIDGKKIAPSFKDIAAKHKGKADAETALVSRLSAGKDHPQVKAKPEDVRTLVKFVLSQ
jgi:cytochrome c